MRFSSIALICLVVLASCQPPTSAKKPVAQAMSVTETSAGDGTFVWESSPLTDVTKKRQVSLSLPAGRAYYLLTNVSESPTANIKLGGVDGSSRSTGGVPERGVAAKSPRRIADPTERVLAPDRPKGTPPSRSLGPAPTFAYDVDDPFTFIDALWGGSSPKAANKHPSTLRKQVTAAGRTLNIWVANDCWDGNANGTVDATPTTNGGTTAWNPPTHEITPAMLDAFAPKFLTDGVNDIYGWDTAVFGAEWADGGTAPEYLYAGQLYTMIDGEGAINIFLVNLNPNGTEDGTLMGYFHALNNFRAADGATGSNEMILFALDAGSLANPDDDGDSSTAGGQGAWALTDYWPAEIVSTLAHEYQHMIHFYQKQVLHNITADTATWINEMCSLLAEDLLAEKLGVPGPRGVPGSLPSAGDPENTGGRLPLFNFAHEWISLTGWGRGATTGINSLFSYSNAYAFGAWLMRNYGGAELVRAIVQSEHTGTQAVVAAVNANGGPTATFASLVRDWGIATFLESSDLAGLAYVSNPDPSTGFNWDFGGEDYNVGSIDLGNYQWGESESGPWVYSFAQFGGVFSSEIVVSSGATLFYDMGMVSGGTRTVTLPANVVLTAVVDQ